VGGDGVVVRALATAGAVLEIRNNVGMTPLLSAVSSQLSPFIRHKAVYWL